jgi:uncharacterized protein (TIGR02391 family)
VISHLKRAIHLATAIRSSLPISVLSSDGAGIEPSSGQPLHPFDLRNIHPKLPAKTRKLFDDGHFPEATFEAAKYVDNCIKKLGKIANKTGYDLMMTAFNEDKGPIRINKNRSQSDRDEQVGMKFLFAGVASGVRNPRGHENEIDETVDECLDNLSVMSFLLRKLEIAGYDLP